jgi:hypothetical protein
VRGNGRWAALLGVIGSLAAAGSACAQASAQTGPGGPIATAPDRPRPHAPTDEIDLSKIETPDLRLLYFDPAETYLTPYIGRAFLNSLRFQKQLFDWKPGEKTTLLLKDFADYGNAAARGSPNNTILIDIAPLSQAFETFSSGERFFTILNHEPVHVATMDVWNGTDATWRRIFHGKPAPVQEHPESILYNYLSTPRVLAPRWYFEGSAVFLETWMAGGFGRAQGGYDEMVFRAMVRDNARFFSPLGLESEGTSIDFQVGVNDYLYGTRFFSWLALTRSPEKVIQWLRRDPGSAAYYSVQFKKVFGESLDDAWQDWIKWEHGFQAGNLKSVSTYPLTPLKPLSPRALGSVSRAFIDPSSGDMIAAFRYPGVIAHVGALSLQSGRVRKLAEIKGSMLYKVTSLAFDPASHTAYFTTDNNAYRNIESVDVRTGARRTLISHGRIGDLAFNPKDKTLWGLRHLNGYVTLVRMDPPYKSWTQIHTFPYGHIPFDLDISPDGTLMSASVGEINGDQSVQVFRIAELGQDEPKPVAELKLGQSTPESFVFSPDGRYLYGSAFYTGVSNIYRLELASQKVDAVSNASTGLFRPIPRPDGSLIAFDYTGQGFTPVSFDPKPLDDLGAIKFLGTEVANQHPIVKSWAVGPPSAVPFDSVVTERGKYHPLHEMKLADTYPVVLGYKGKVAVGGNVVFEDPLQFDQLSATLAYSPAGGLPASERIHADLQFHTIAWKFEYWHNNADFYDLTGPTERARKGDAAILSYQRALIYDPPQQLDFKAEAGGYFGLDTLPGAQNVPTGALDRNIGSLALKLDYQDTNKSLGAVDHERGFLANVAFEPDVSSGGAYPRIRGGLAIGAPLGGSHASLWLYTAAGASFGNAANPLGSYYLGGFGNNYIDNREVERYRQYDSFPGFEIDGIAARTFAKAMGEFNLPPIRFAEVGRPSFYLGYLRGALFAGAMQVGPPSGGAQTLASVGGQADLNFTVALRLPMTFSIGYARGFRLDGGPASAAGRQSGGEVMASLKIM